MFGNYIKVALRNIGKRKFYSFINAVGLSIGIAFCTLIYLYINDEKSFDQFHANKEQIYMIMGNGFSQDAFKKGEPDPIRHSASMPGQLAEVMREELSGVENVTRFSKGSGLMQFENKVFEETVNYVDSGFFKMFSFEMLAGSPVRLFSKTSDAVITDAIAEKYFGNLDPLGKTFSFGNDTKKTFMVAAIVATPPAQSSISFGVLLPTEAKPWYKELSNNWGMWSYATFVQLKKQTQFDSFRGNYDKLIEKYMGEMFKSWQKDFKIPEGYKAVTFDFIKLEDVHHNTKLSWHKVSDRQYSFILGGIALLILIIACINYISLALTSSIGRRIEVGIRKTVGAQKRQILYQFAIESMTLALLSMVIGLVLMMLFLPAFNLFTGKSIALSSNLQRIVPAMISISLLTGILAGSYPAWYLSAFKPALVLKGRLSSILTAGITKPLVVLQFAMSGFLIISAMIMYKQMKFITTKNLGYDQEHVLVVPTHAGWSHASDRMVGLVREATKSDPAIVSVSGASSSFGDDEWSNNGYSINGETKFSYVYRVDPYYLKTLGMELLQGRNFDELNPADTTQSIIVNEALVRDMKWDNPLQEHLNWRGDSLSKGPRVIGVVKDYNFMSLESKVEPVLLSLDEISVGNMLNILVKISGNDVAATIERLKTTWLTLAPDKPFEYTFLDENVAKQYESYERWTSIMGLSTLFAIVIAALGLFGLAGINAVNRTHEIGIRKVLGAELSSIFILLNKQYVWLSLAAFVIAAPLSAYAMTKWLSSFQFRIAMGWELFAMSLLGGMAVALTAVSYHSIRAARRNPAETIKYE